MYKGVQTLSDALDYVPHASVPTIRDPNPSCLPRQSAITKRLLTLVLVSLSKFLFSIYNTHGPPPKPPAGSSHPKIFDARSDVSQKPGVSTYTNRPPPPPNKKVWTFDQLQGILYVIVPVRMTVIKLEKSEGGGLFVYAPVAPTAECLAMMRGLEAEHGPVRHIVLGTLGLEHKVFAGPFAQRFSQARVWFTPGQYRCVFIFCLV